MGRAHLSTGAILYIAAVTGAAMLAALLLWSAASPAASAALFVLITLLGMIAHSFPVRASRHQAYQATLPFIVVAAASFNSLQLMVFILLIHAAEQARVHRAWYIQLFNVGDYFVAAAISGLVFHEAVRLLTPGLLSSTEAALAAGCTFVLLNRILLAGILWLARSLPPSRSGLFRSELLAVDLIITWISAPMLVLTLVAGPWMTLITAGPLFLARPALAYLLSDDEHQTHRVRAPAA